MKISRLFRGGLVLTVAAVSLAALLVCLRANGHTRAERNTIALNPSPQSSYLFRFDPNLSVFYVYTLSVGSVPNGVAVTGTSPTHVWLTEMGRNVIGHLVYTDAEHVSFIEYPITSSANSEPFRIAVNGNDVWFTERGANRVGRLDTTTGQITEFYGNGLSPNAGLADIRVAPNGWVWTTGQMSNKLIRLVVTSTAVFEFTEYTDTLMIGPFGLAVESDNSIWFTAPDAHRVGQFTPSDGSFLMPFGFPSSSMPFEVVVVPGYVWFSDLGHNSIDQIEIGTWSIVNPYGPVSQPAGLASASSNVFWITQQDEKGALGRMVYTSTTQTSLDYYPLPTSGLRPTGIAVAADNGVWFGAFSPFRAFLPVVMRDYDPVPPLFSVQMYGSINASTGFTRVVEAGAKWIRFSVDWAGVEPVRGSYNWDSIDASMQTMIVSDVYAIATIVSNPSWAAARLNGPVTNTVDLQEFVGTAVARYPQVTYWEFYNEPDSKNSFGLNGAGYAAMLQAIYPVVKSANPNAQVVLGGLALDWFLQDGGGGPFDKNFLPTVLSHCASPCFDVANFHYYPAFRPVWEPYGHDIIGKSAYVRQVLTAYGYNRPVINTEIGWPSASTWGSLELEARYVPKAYVRGLAAGLPVVSWYGLVDTDSSNPGLLGPGLTPRPAFTAYKTMTSLLAGERYVRAIPPSETGSARIEGYEFSVPGHSGRKRLDVYWYDCPSMSDASLYVNGTPVDCSTTAPLTINAARIAQMDKLGAKVVLNDGNDGRLDERVNIPVGVGSSPIYIDYAP